MPPMRQRLKLARGIPGAKSGLLKTAQQKLAEVPKSDKPAAGKRFNEVKTALESALAAAQERLADRGGTDSTDPFDPTLPGGSDYTKGRHAAAIGHLHPLTQTIEELKDIMGRAGLHGRRRAGSGRRVA